MEKKATSDPEINAENANNTNKIVPQIMINIGSNDVSIKRLWGPGSILVSNKIDFVEFKMASHSPLHLPYQALH